MKKERKLAIKRQICKDTSDMKYNALTSGTRKKTAIVGFKYRLYVTAFNSHTFVNRSDTLEKIKQSAKWFIKRDNTYCHILQSISCNISSEKPMSLSIPLALFILPDLTFVT